MSHDVLPPPVLTPAVPVVEPPAVDGAATPAPTQEQVQAADQVFAQRDEESRQVAALFGLQAGVLLGHQMLVETLQRAEERDEAGPPPDDQPDE